MAYTVEDFYKEFTLKHLDWLTPDERLKGLKPEEIKKIEEYLKKMRHQTN